jgi:CRP/FNR family cyclic AMP-dependent transcriptional regulator
MTDLTFDEAVPAGTPRGSDSAGEGGTERLAQLLEEVIPFSVLHPADLEILGDRGRSRAYLPNEVIFRQGEPSKALYVIDRGQVKLSAAAPNGKERLIAILGRGQIFGELEIFDGGTRGMTARAKDRVEVFILPRHLLQAIMRTRPAFVRRLLELLARRLRRADQAVQDLVFFDAPTRLARRLLDLASEHGIPDEAGRKVRIDVRLTQHEVGQMIGVNRSSVNRALRELADRNLIEWNGGSPEILDLAALVAMSQS